MVTDMKEQLKTIYDNTGVFQAFEEISSVPRGSKYNTKISDFLISFAKEHDIEVHRDEAENIIMIREASPEKADCAAVMLQGHMDMVCQKRPDCTHDFLKEGLCLKTDGEWIYAEGTTLGADDGIALAYIMSLMADKTLSCPRIEAVITTDEEIGMDGAYALDVSGLQAKYLLNLDSEEEGVFLTSCAGGLTCEGVIPVKREMLAGFPVKLRISGLKGGHSGEDINKNRTNAVALLGRLVHELEQAVPEGRMRFIKAQGGDKDNVIPARAEAVLLFAGAESELDPELEYLQRLEHAFTEIRQVLLEELSISEPTLAFDMEIKREQVSELALDAPSDQNIKNLLYFVQTGVMVMSARMEGFVESSQNLGIFELLEERALVRISVRSSVRSAKYALAEKCRAFVTLCGGSCETKSEYPAWEYKENSKLRAYIERVYEEQYGQKPVFKAIHAGLECGILAEKKPELDIISMGPNVVSIHTPDEKMHVQSAQRVYQFVRALLEKWDFAS